MTMDERETSGQETLHREQERYIEQTFPTGTVTHDRVKGFTDISFPSGAKITLDWVAFEREDLVNCIYLDFPLPGKLENALRHWNFTELFLSQAGNENMENSVHEILTLRDKRYTGSSIVYHYVQDRIAILSHPWSENFCEASTICNAWINNARKSIIQEPESNYFDMNNLREFVTGIPGFMVNKASGPSFLQRRGINTEQLAKQIQAALTKKKP